MFIIIIFIIIIIYHYYYVVFCYSLVFTISAMYVEDC